MESGLRTPAVVGPASLAPSREPGQATEKLPLALIGCDFRRATSSKRSLLVLDDAAARDLLDKLRHARAAEGLVELTTCNRCEWIVESECPDWAASLLRAWMVCRLGPGAEGSMEPYVFLGDAAADHIFSVVMGRQSLVVGERQVAGQFFASLEQARDRGGSTRLLNGIGAVAGRLLRNADRAGLLGSHSRGVHVEAIDVLRRRFACRERPRVAVVGLGAIGRRVRGLAEAETGWCVVPCNRTAPPGGDVRPLDDLADVLADVDAAVVCTGAPEPTVRATHVAGRSPDRPLLLIDLGIPEQVASDLAQPAERHGLDELGANRPEPAPEAADVAGLIGRAVAELRQYSREPEVRGALADVRRRHRRLVGEELPRLVDERCSDLPEEARGRLVHDLNAALGSFTHDLLRIVKGA